MRILAQDLFLSRLASELARPAEHFAPAATLVGDLALDQLELFQVVMFVGGMTPTSALGGLDWERATLGDVYKLYVAEAVQNAMAGPSRPGYKEEAPLP